MTICNEGLNGQHTASLESRQHRKRVDSERRFDDEEGGA